jgi:hypothetical protein
VLSSLEDGQLVLALSDEELRAAGLSASKAASLRDLSAKVLDGTVVLEPRRLARESDAEVLDEVAPTIGYVTVVETNLLAWSRIARCRARGADRGGARRPAAGHGDGQVDLPYAGPDALR